MHAPKTSFGVYIHWPFCAQKCPYCDFNSHVRFSGWDEDRFLAAYLRELDYVAGATSPSAPLPEREWDGGTPSPSAPLPEREWDGGTPSPSAPLPEREWDGGTPSPSGRLPERESEGGKKTVTSIFFGGGTPSLMKPQTTAAILEHIGKLWHVAPDAEITLEANPGSVEAARFRGYRAAGVNRVSMGLQSLRDAELKKLGRIHTVDEAKAALSIARATFERVSFDLIYARPGQTPQQWREELREALQLAGDHISLYQLTIEPDTPYAALHAAGKLVVPDEDAAAALYEITQEMTAAKGLAAYEISNHAQPGAESRHNLLYWRYGEYAGVGPGAHGRLLYRPKAGAPSRHATVAERHPETWAARVEEHGHGYIEETPLTAGEEADEMLLMGLRLTEGVDLTRLARLGGVRPSREVLDELSALGLLEAVDGHAPQPARWRGDELAEIPFCLGPGLAPETPLAVAHPSPARIRATPRGRFVLNAVVARLSASFTPVAAPPAMDIGAPGA